MNKTKRKFTTTQYYQDYLIKQKLNDMALKGYKLNKITKSGWLFEETSPTMLKYDISYCEEVPVIEDWDFVCSYYNMHVFSNEKYDEFSIESFQQDEELKLQLINKVMMKTVVLIFSVLFVITTLQFCTQFNYTRSFPLEALGYNSPIFAIGFLLAMFSTLIPLFSYTLWYDKSKEQVVSGGKCYVSKKSYNKVVISLIVASFVTLILPAISVINSVSSPNIITKTIVYENGMSRKVELYQDEIPVTFQDLGFEDDEYYSYNNSFNINSFFVRYNQSHQSKLYTTQEILDELIHLDYNIIDVKFSPCFTIILNSLIDTTKINSNFNSEQQQQYISNEYPNVDNLYQLFYGDIPTGKYVVTKGNRIVVIEFYAYLPSDELLELAIEKLLQYQ